MSESQSQDPKQKTALVRHDDAEAFVISLLQAEGVRPDDAKVVAKALVQADLRGVESHGINRIPSYLARIRTGGIDPLAVPTVEMVTGCVAKVDGHNALGPLPSLLAVRTAITLANQHGIGLVGVSHSNHFGMSAWLVREALDAGYISLIFTNSSPALPPWGGRVPLLGVSPIAAGAPAGEKSGVPFLLDMAPSVVARGKVHKAMRRGEQIPLGWGLDSKGRETTDPREVINGGWMMPIAGYKGTGLAMMMDVFAGVFTGAAFAGDVTGPYDTSGKPGEVGHLVVVMKPDLFVSAEEFRRRMDVLYERVVGCEKAEGVDRIYFPGEIEQLTEERRIREGIPFVQDEIDALNREAERLGVEKIKVVENP